MCISRIILYYCDVLIFYVTAILYLFAGGHKCRLTTFPIRFAHDVSIMCYCHCSEQMNKYHVISLVGVFVGRGVKLLSLKLWL